MSGFEEQRFSYCMVGIGIRLLIFMHGKRIHSQRNSPGSDELGVEPLASSATALLY